MIARRPPDDAALERLLDEHATFAPAPLCPEVRVFLARDGIQLWAAAEALAGGPLDEAPFWALPWPAGLALARWILDDPARVRGACVLDIGAGGGVASLAAARAGAARVVAADRDPWALAVARLAARRQGLAIEPVEADLALAPPEGRFDLVLAADMAYDRSESPLLRARIDALASAGARVAVADAGRKFFDPGALVKVLEVEAPTLQEIDGCRTRRALVYSSA